MPGRKLHIATYGCQMNVYDSDRLSEIMSQQGWTMTEIPSEADFIFVNTCSIREKAARRVIGHLKRLKAIKNQNPDLILGVGGCVAEQEGKNLLTEVPWLNLIVGPGRLYEIPTVVENLTTKSPPVILSGRPPSIEAREVNSQVVHSQAANSQEATSQIAIPIFTAKPNQPIPSVSNHTKPPKVKVGAFLTIMTGCDNYCAYCVVPYLRGPETSRPLEEITFEAKTLIEKGAKEITLLGQNVNSYGRPGRRGGEDFIELLEIIGSLPGLERLRFTTSHPKDFPPKLVELFGSLPTLCEHLHLPLQAGSDKILTAMGRRYNRDKYLALVKDLRKACPSLALSTDIIVGFPGESESDFNQTLDALETIGFDSIYSFKYSDRPMTRANNLPDKVDELVKARRLSEVQNIQKKITLDKHHALVGRELEVLVEGFGRHPGQLTGRTRDLKPVNFDGPETLLGSLVTVKITEAYAASLLGQMVNF
ncbi:MAG: MiaB/RimO family radical SAM methylthiotransferase [Deltaproteobacteria bacterium]|jgi:tRNA-2-methylthio-N6-dimethylallyladenosine synthase|nr:MiaB/RimO family radical SAM methylthiotransferase [Deltaproteobacteria bacterium]